MDRMQFRESLPCLLEKLKNIIAPGFYPQKIAIARTSGNDENISFLIDLSTSKRLIMVPRNGWRVNIFPLFVFYIVSIVIMMGRSLAGEFISPAYGSPPLLYMKVFMLFEPGAMFFS